MSNRPPSLKSLRKASTLPQLTLSEAFGRSATVAAGAVAAAKKSDNISSRGDEGSSRGEESDEVVVVEEVAGEVAQAAGSTAVDKPDEVDVVASGGTPNDIGEGYNLASQKWTCLPSSLSSDEKCRLVDHHFVPGPKHDFPVHTGNDGRNRRFRHQWLEDNTWLVYSPKCDGGFCLPCLLFPSGADQGQLTARPMSNFKKATTLLDKHGSQATHKDAVARQGQFKKVVSAGIQGNCNVCEYALKFKKGCKQIAENCRGGGGSPRLPCTPLVGGPSTPLMPVWGVEHISAERGLKKHSLPCQMTVTTELACDVLLLQQICRVLRHAVHPSTKCGRTKFEPMNAVDSVD